MAKLSYNEQAYFENMLEMGGGYVLDFSNESFQRFVFSVLDIDIYQKYEYQSKAKLLRKIIDDFSDREVGKLLMSLLEYKRTHLDVTPDKKEEFVKCVQIGNRLLGKKYSNNPPKKKSKIVPSFDFDKSFKGICKLAEIDNSQRRGFEFERYLNEFFNDNNLNARSSFKIIGEQIDGSFEFQNEIYLLEAKWTKKKTQKSELVIFNEKVNSKSSFTRGLFISFSGYTEEAIKTFGMGRKVSIILMTVQELTILIQRKTHFNDVLKKKIRILAEEGDYFRHISNLV